MDLIDAIACGLQGYKVAGQGRGIAGNIVMRGAPTSASKRATRSPKPPRGGSTTNKSGHGAPGGGLRRFRLRHFRLRHFRLPLSDRTLPGCGRFGPSLMSEFGQILLGPGVRHLSINRQIVLKIFGGCL